ncbi:hypothetical protein OPV22_032514 [Ensete ventricosum]|uniref:Uncharacterized protein n=1 Tax=Ensete ventricosum TaxID=4639 RepID=A0AAV8PYH5_ENSVE|nr:hypothetical protein OPV22_032514 [Ensete ventricosum]
MLLEMLFIFRKEGRILIMASVAIPDSARDPPAPEFFPDEHFSLCMQVITKFALSQNSANEAVVSALLFVGGL